MKVHPGKSPTISIWSLPLLLGLGVVALVLVGCGSASVPSAATPLSTPATTSTAGDPVAALGAALFVDRRLSGNGAQACVDCHRPDLAYADGLRTAVGSTGEVGHLNTPSLINAGDWRVLGWARPELTSLEIQIPNPLFGTAPIEMGAKGHEEEILARLRADPSYPATFQAAFPDDPSPIRWERIVGALAAYVRTLRGTGPFDRFLAGDPSALSAEARRGYALFVEVGCSACHSGPLLASDSYHNTGLYNLDGKGAYPPGAEGLIRSTHNSADMGKFRVPSLRNIARTAPYYHDGSAATLADVLDTYVAGGRGPGITSPLKSPAIVPLTLSAQDRADLLAFLESLTDDPAPTP